MTGPVPRPRTVAVVGGSLAGVKTVQRLRANGFDGRVTLISAERHLPYDRTPLSKHALSDDWEPSQSALATCQELADADVDVLLGRAASALDVPGRAVVLQDGSRVRFDAAVLATGSAARHLPGAMPAGVHVLRTLEDAQGLRASLQAACDVVVVGGGFIGGEIASAARDRGLRVTVVEAAALPLSGPLGSTLARRALSLATGRGVQFELGVGVRRLLGKQHVRGVELSDGRVLPADVVVVGIGAAPAVGWLERSGLVVGDSVSCDAGLQTAAPGVYAAGDIARWRHPVLGIDLRVEHWTTAVEHGQVAADNICGLGRVADGLPYFWSDQHRTRLQSFGHRRSADEVSVVRDEEADDGPGVFLALHHRGGHLTAVFGWGAAKDFAALRAQVRRGAPVDRAVALAG